MTVVYTDRWVLPYIDQPMAFWDGILDLTAHKALIYCPLPESPIGTGRPLQAKQHLTEFLVKTDISKSLLLNPVILPQPIEELATPLLELLRRFTDKYGINEVVVSDVLLARRIREKLPGLAIAASTLTDLASPRQLAMVEGVFDVITPATRIMRDMEALWEFRRACHTRVRLLLNEACLPGCPFRTQHFHEMNSDLPYPRSLCSSMLEEKPWLRLTGAWILPQHLHLFDGLHDELKLAGRVTLQDPEKYRSVLAAYLHKIPMTPDGIGGGPASPLEPVKIAETFYVHTLNCGGNCSECSRCEAEYKKYSLKTDYHTH